MAKKKKEPAKASTAWQGTYGDMITLMLCFFVMLYDPSEVDVTAMSQIASSLQLSTMTTETTSGGKSLAAGRMADLGNTITQLPAEEKGKSLGTAKKKAVSLLTPDVKSNKVAITSDERGLVITLQADSFFKPSSAQVEIDETRETLLRLSQFFNSKEVSGKKFRIEGHTDNTPVSPDSEFVSNWELSATRAINVLHYLSDFGVNEDNFSVTGYANTRPKFDNTTPEGQAYNRRVDIIVLDEGHF